ncbi:auxin signaling F-box protein 5 [Prunus yedoensis var. nudiflora]|uniref:Auxin signaling F-box protein 5 n=1 Tax=Prunus yedoensis var. nudiflora TaxID=2094558 RepID=A0A314XJG2_PRUYE|nr:auxin signaling F-box protein 5 [Prunus yedoensis var. nudiflora]
MPAHWGAHLAPWVSSMAKAYPWLEKLFLKRMSVTDDDLALLAESFPGFKELVLVCCDGFGTSGLAVVASKCRQLRVLDLLNLMLWTMMWIGYVVFRRVKPVLNL